MRKFGFFIVVLGIGICLTISHFASPLFQERNPIPMLISAAKLQFSNSDYVLVAKTDKRRKYLSENTKNQGYKIVKEYMNTEDGITRNKWGLG